MISHGVEISIAGGGADEKDASGLKLGGFYIPRVALPVVNGTVLHMSERPSYRLCASEA